MSSKLVLKTGNGIIQTGNGINFPILRPWIKNIISIMNPIYKTGFGVHGKDGKSIVKEVFFDLRFGNRRNNSISCLDDSVSCF